VPGRDAGGKEQIVKLESLKDLFVHELKDLYNAESQLVKALPRMVRAANADDLKEALEHHLEQTREHATRLEQVLSDFGTAGRGVKCEGMAAIIEEGKKLMESDAAEDTMDAGLIGAAQKAEHYEIAGYGTARTWARTLGLHDAAQILQQTLEEEAEANEKLTQIAEASINVAAAEDEQEEEEMEESQTREGSRAGRSRHR
jgi:ferritin-like metal-binding protein YciE